MERMPRARRGIGLVGGLAVEFEVEADMIEAEMQRS